MGEDDVAVRLREARLLAGYADATAAARAFGWRAPTYLAHENGSRGVRLPVLRKYARAFQVDADWLANGRGQPRAERVEVEGFLGAGEQILGGGGGSDSLDERVPVPAGFRAGMIGAFKVRGDSMRPLRDGWTIYFRKDQDGVPADALNQICVIQLEDGRRFLKELRRGYSKNKYNLVSWTAGVEPMEDQMVDWASPVISITPRA